MLANRSSSHRFVVRVVLATALAAAAPPALARPAPGDWISWHNGPSNARRADGETLRVGWREAWRSPNYTQALVKNGVVFVEKDAVYTADVGIHRHHFAALDIRTGVEKWRKLGLPGLGSYTSAGCIAGTRVFVPHSQEAAGAGNLTHRIEGRNLEDGSCGWIYDSSETGTVCALQAIPPSAQTGGANWLVCLTEQHNQLANYYGRSCLRVFDADHSEGLPLYASQEVIDDRWSPAAISIAGPFVTERGTIWNAFVHDNNWPSSNVHKSVDLRVMSLASPVESPGYPFAANPLLSGTTITTQQSASRCPLVIDADGAHGYLVESGGLLHAYDLLNGVELSWSPVTLEPSASAIGHECGIALLDGTDELVVLQGDNPLAQRYSLADGSRILPVVELPAAPLPFGFSVLDDDRVLIGLTDGRIVALEPDGSVVGPIHTQTDLQGLFAAEGRFFVQTSNELICYEPASKQPAFPQRK